MKARWRKLRRAAARPFWWLGNAISDSGPLIEHHGEAMMDFWVECDSEAQANALFDEITERLCGCYPNDDCVRGVCGSFTYTAKDKGQGEA